jgi:phospholipase C
MPKNIQHMVVLMMENRSFDHALGFLKSNTYPIDGLNGTETNPDSKGVAVRVSRDANYAGDLASDPGHDFISVNEQIFGNSQGTGTGPFMQGFVKAYESKTKNVGKSHRIMKCFNPTRLPALATLAQEYALCDRWFASVPGPTLPNRAFVYGATSQGRVNMSPNYFTLRTIFELLSEQNVSSKIYFPDWALGLAVGHILDNAKKYLASFDAFISDCKKNALPAYSFIEPRYNDLSTPGSFIEANDQHPDHNVFKGEMLIKTVYDALTSNQQTWESTLLVITYDEHGGLFDHVKPPDTVNPDGKNSEVPPFNFQRLGVRVPCVLVSPFIPRGTIVHDVFDHTSVIATARKLFLKDPEQHFLTERDRRANTFEKVLTLPGPRPGKVTIPQPVAVSSPLLAAKKGASKKAQAAARADRPLSDFQQAMLVQAFKVDTDLPAAGRTHSVVSAVNTEQTLAEYLASLQARLVKGRRKRPAKAQSARGQKTGRKTSRKTGSKKR